MRPLVIISIPLPLHSAKTLSARELQAIALIHATSRSKTRSAPTRQRPIHHVRNIRFSPSILGKNRKKYSSTQP